MRDSFYQAIKSHWNFLLDLSIYNSDCILQIAKYKGDIFMGINAKQLERRTYSKEDSFKEFCSDLKNNYFPFMMNDFFEKNLIKQLRHEMLVKDYLTINNVTEVTVGGDRYKFDVKESFKIDFDFT